MSTRSLFAPPASWSVFVVAAPPRRATLKDVTYEFCRLQTNFAPDRVFDISTVTIMEMVPAEHWDLRAGAIELLGIHAKGAIRLHPDTAARTSIEGFGGYDPLAIGILSRDGDGAVFAHRGASGARNVLEILDREGESFTEDHRILVSSDGFEATHPDEPGATIVTVPRWNRMAEWHLDHHRSTGAWATGTEF